MSSTSEVANLAAVRIGSEARIASLDDDRPLPRTLKAVWNIERRATLRDGAWNFAARRGALAEETVDDAAAIYPYTNRHRMPAEALRLIELLNDSARIDYQLEGGNVLCSVGGPLYARWIIDVPEPANWDDAFAEAFACRLAWKCGHKIAGSSFDQNAAWTEYRMAIGRAGGTDAKENPPIEQEESDWILARLGGDLRGSFDPRIS